MKLKTLVTLISVLALTVNAEDKKDQSLIECSEKIIITTSPTGYALNVEHVIKPPSSDSAKARYTVITKNQKGKELSKIQVKVHKLNKGMTILLDNKGHIHSISEKSLNSSLNQDIKKAKEINDDLIKLNNKRLYPSENFADMIKIVSSNGSVRHILFQLINPEEAK